MEQINHIDLDARSVVPFPAALTPSALLNLALSQGASVDVLAQFMQLRERHEARQAKRAFANAMAAAQAEFPVVVKDQRASFGAGKAAYDYASFAEITRAIKPVLARHGLSYRFRTLNDERTIMVTCVVSHVDGHSEENELVAPLDFSGNKNPLHALGSSEQYLMRYTLMPAFGLAAAKDDDGCGATAETITPKQCADLEALAIETNSEISRIEDYCAKRIGRTVKLAELPVSEFETIMRMLVAKREKGQRS